jgi:hypothetical protein
MPFISVITEISDDVSAVNEKLLPKLTARTPLMHTNAKGRSIGDTF